MINNIVWLALDKTIPVHDATFYYLGAVELFKIPLPEVLNIISYSTRPPLITILPYLFFKFLTPSPDLAIISIQIFYVILILATYGVGKNLINKKTGLLSAFFTAAVPINFALSKCFMPAIPLASFVILTTYFMLKSNHFYKTSYTLFFALSTSLGLLTKATFILFILPVITIYFSPKKDFKLKSLLNITAAVSIIAGISGWWHFRSFKNCLLYYTGAGNLSSSLSAFIQSFNIQEYFFQLYAYILSPLYFILLSIAIIYIFISKKGLKLTLSGLFCSFLPHLLLLFFCGQVILARYYIPSLPFFCLLIAFSISLIKNKKIYNLTITFISSAIILQFFILSYTNWTDRSFLNFESIKNFPGASAIYGKFGIDLLGFQEEKITTLLNNKLDAKIFILQQELNIKSQIFEEALISNFKTTGLSYIVLYPFENKKNIPRDMCDMHTAQKIISYGEVSHIILIKQFSATSEELKEFYHKALAGNQFQTLFKTLSEANRELYEYFFVYGKQYKLKNTINVTNGSVELYEKQ